MSPSVAAPRLISVEEAKRIVLEHARPLGIEDVALAASLGRVLTQDVIAGADLPPFDNSAMDGYAIRATDTAGASNEHPVTLRLIGEVAAGQVLEGMLSRGEATKIMTGAPLPSGADSVVMLEDARLRGEGVEIRRPVPVGSHVRRAGEDVRAGNVVLTAGTRIRLQHLGLLAGLGCAMVSAYRLPSVAIVATGSELIRVDEPLRPGTIRNANSVVLDALLRRCSVQPKDLGTVIDEPTLIRERLEEAAGADLILVSGGVSVGEHDLVKRILRELGMETLFWRVNMKPGKPLLCGRWRSSVVFGLPGNPISCVVGFVEFIWPFLRGVMGQREPAPGRVHARLTQPFRKQEPRTQFLTARLKEEEGMLVVTPTPQQGSGMLASLSQADVFIVIPETTTQLEAGAVVEVVPFGDASWPS